ncbi:MAG: hypothetical protein GY869_20210, partial [Planctomycetes bacterium]|nr:hypothetical protein [Planctomycetota bacterium]
DSATLLFGSDGAPLGIFEDGFVFQFEVMFPGFHAVNGGCVSLGKRDLD